MRLESTPQRQQEHNEAVHRRVRMTGSLALLLILASIALQAALYFNLRAEPSEPTLVAPDGSTLIGFAVPVTPDYALTNADTAPGSQLMIGSNHVQISIVRTEKINGIAVTLLRLQTSYPKEIPSLRLLQNGEAASATSLSGKWEGSLTESSASAPIEAQPAIAIGDIAALTAKVDNALLGISVPGPRGDVPLTARDLLARFPELKK